MPRPKKGQKFVKGKYHPALPEKYKGTYPIEYRSSWELAFCRFCDKTPGVVNWGSESTVVYYNDPGRGNSKHRYFIDFTMVVKNANGKLEKFLVEIKPFCETQLPKMAKRRTQKSEKAFETRCKTYITNQAKWEAATIYAKQKGSKFVVITERDLF